MNKFFIFLMLLSVRLFSQSDSAVVLSEIMFYPQSGNNEFIEIYNTSSKDSIDLNGYRIIYQTSSGDSIVSAGYGTILPPKTFGVIFQGDYDFENGIYKSLVPSNSLQLKISDNYFGSRGMSNSSDRTIYLVGPSDDTLQIYTYSADNSKGFSDEKIVLNEDNSASNWANSKVENGTPGFHNSVTKYSFDLEVSNFNVFPKTIIEGENATLNIAISNLGKETASTAILNIYNDLNFDSTGTANEILDSQSLPNINPSDSTSVTFTLSEMKAGRYNLIAEVQFNKDEQLNNNKKFLELHIYKENYKYNDIAINEIMFAPKGDEPEWIELYNKSDSSVNIKSWTISDGNTTTKIYEKDFYLPKENYIVLSNDSLIFNYYKIPSQTKVLNLPSLNNTGDNITLKDSLGTLIDSVSYLPSWGGNNGNSLERISADGKSNNSANWGSSKVRGTPGKINSLSKKNYDIEITSMNFSPKSPIIGGNVNIKIEVKNIGYEGLNFYAKLYEDVNSDSLPDNLLSTTQTFSLSSNDSTTINFPYTIKNLTAQRNFFAEVFAKNDQDTTNNFIYGSISPGASPKTVLINEIMYDPVNGEPEWFEIYNISNDSIDLEGWKVSDVLTAPTTTIINNPAVILPKSFLVITKDSSIINFHKVIPSGIVQIDLPTLNNDEDGVVLKDNHGITIDSVFYQQDWGNKKGVSLERISLSAPSNLSSNWGNSVDIENSTPGRINSITPKDYDLTISNISSFPQFPVNGDSVNLSAAIKNVGSNEAKNFMVEFSYDSNGDNKIDKTLGQITLNNLIGGDSTIATSPYKIPDLQTKTLAAVKIIYGKDEDTLNNYMEGYIQPGFPKKSLLINEIMYAPMNGEPEWIEVVNTSSKSLNLKNWMIQNSNSSKVFMTNNDYFLSPKEYLILTKDSSFFDYHSKVKSKVLITNIGTLKNSSDEIKIYDFRNALIDDLSYKSDWGGKNGFSLERISLNSPTNDSTNWLTSLSKDRSTPGQPNSILSIPVYNKHDLVINEIMFDPAVNNSEFVEFENISSTSVNVGGWKIEGSNGNTYELSEISHNVEPNNYFVLAADSSIINNYDFESYDNIEIINSNSLGLSNTNDLILLKDVRDKTIDSVFYSSKWHNSNFTNTKNISLERINPFLDGNDPSNWSSSASTFGATPGKQNSIYTTNKNLQSSISVSPDPFSPDNDGFEDYTIINYRLSQKISQVRIKIFDSKGRLVRTLLNNSPSGSKGSVIFDGKDDNGNPLRIGIYIVFLEATNQNTGFEKDLKTVVVVARKL